MFLLQFKLRDFKDDLFYGSDKSCTIPRASVVINYITGKSIGNFTSNCEEVV